jgi:hypothetical protein
MKTFHQRLICATVCSVMAATAAASAREEPAHPLQPRSSQEVLAAMSRSSTWGHPDEYGEFTGMQRYTAGNYTSAMKYFLIGARYADKLSQLSIGLMYLNGQGVQTDPVKAFAWIAIAAERKYPAFLATRDRVWGQLDPTQREQAKALITDLYATYGDKFAKPLMAHAPRLALMAGTGLGLGYDKSGMVVTNSTNNPPPACGADTIDGAPIAGCGDLYTDWRWNPKKYFAARDGAWTGTVTVGKVQQGAAGANGNAPPPKKP